MVILPKQFVALPRYPGYFWNTEDKRLYSCKMSGVLVPLTLKKAYRGIVRWVGPIDRPDGYSVSVKGNRQFISLKSLMKVISTDEVQTFPVATR